MNATFLPEACYKYEPHTFEELYRSYLQNKSVVGIVKDINVKKEELKISLGDSIYGILPFSEVTIYPLTYSDNPAQTIPSQIVYLRYKKICVQITSIIGNDILLSRRVNMLEAFEQLKAVDQMSLYVTNVCTTSVFGDVGEGVYGRIPLAQLCKSRIRSASEICHRNDLLFVNPLICDEENKRFLVSYRSTFPDYNPKDYRVGDPIVCTVNEPIDGSLSGFYVWISPNVCGILDYKSWYPAIHYGDKVECVIKSATSKGLHLRFAHLFK